MRYKTFLIEGYGNPDGARGKNIKQEEAVKLLNTKCKKSVKYFRDTSTTLYRGVTGNDYYFVDPSKSTRVSQYTDNFYTLMIDNGSAWRKYPKRSKSVICTTNSGKAQGYGGNNFHLFAFDGARYGVAPEDDIWESFRVTLGNINLGMVNEEIHDLANAFNVSSYLHNNMDYNDLMNVIQMISDELKDMNSTDYNQMKQNYTLVKLSSHYPKLSFADWFEDDAYDPDNNGFFVTKDIAKVFQGGKKWKEVWTDAPCVLVATYLSLPYILDGIE